MNQQESKVQLMNQRDNKEGRQVIWQRTPIHRISPITLTTWKVAKTTTHNRGSSSSSNTSRGSHLDPELYTIHLVTLSL